jgi:hypothetical protein
VAPLARQRSCRWYPGMKADTAEAKDAVA